MIWILALQLLVASLAQGSSQNSLPLPPQYSVLDSAKVLSPSAIMTLSTLLIQHDQLTGQQFIIAIFGSRTFRNPAETSTANNPIQWTKELFDHWKVGNRGQSNGILLSVFIDSKEAAIQLGVGMDTILTSEKLNEIIQDYIIPELKMNQPTKAIAIGVYQILEAIQSPLIESGQFNQILAQTGFNKNYLIPSKPSLTHSWGLFVALGLLLIGFVFYEILAREALFTKDGWFRYSSTPLVELLFLYSSVYFSQPSRHSQGPPLKKSPGLRALSPIPAAIRKVEEEAKIELRIYITQRWLESNPTRRARRLSNQIQIQKDLSPQVLIYINLHSKRITMIDSQNQFPLLNWKDFELEFQENLIRNMRMTERENAVATSVAWTSQQFRNYSLALS